MLFKASPQISDDLQKHLCFLFSQTEKENCFPLVHSSGHVNKTQEIKSKNITPEHVSQITG